MEGAKRLTAQIGVLDYFKRYVDIPTFLNCCRACPNFGRKWSCPPFGFSPEAYWKRFQTLHIYGLQIPVPAKTRERAHSPDELSQLIDKTLWAEKRRLNQELIALEREHPNSVSLSAGSCKCCARCSRPAGVPCLQPSRMRYSIEALGGDVGRTAKELLGIEIQWAKDGIPPPYFTLVCGLLLPEQE